MTEIFSSTLNSESFFHSTDYTAFFALAEGMPYPELLYGQAWLHIMLIFALALFNGLFVAAEVAFIKLRAAQLDGLGPEFDASTVDLTRKIFQNLDRYIPACKFGASISGTMLGAISVPFLVQFLLPLVAKLNLNLPELNLTIAFIFALVIAIAMLVVVGKVIPNSLGFRHELNVSLKTARALHVFFICFAPLILILAKFSNWFLESVLRIKPAIERESDHSAEDIKIFVEESGKDAVTETEKEILINTLELNDLKVKDIMIPRKEVVTLNVKDSFEEILEKAYTSKHTRFPLVDGHLDETLGQIHVKDLLRLSQENKTNLKANKRKLIRVEEEMALDQLLKSMLNNKAHIALVGDEFGGADGLVMLNDLMEILVGDIQDEFEDGEEPQVAVISKDEYVVAGSMPLHELDDEVPELDLASPGVSTVGGYVTALMGHLPKTGERSSVDGFDVIVTEADEKKVVEVKFKRIEPEDLTEVVEEKVAESKSKNDSPTAKGKSKVAAS